MLYEGGPVAENGLACWASRGVGDLALNATGERPVLARDTLLERFQLVCGFPAPRTKFSVAVYENV